ncbi:MAG: SAM-dependent methyltransferase [Alphaproteobacteria bacterium]|nr:MAG: SAM-dependent methyltransferase [Alphaproteobacteria bacterium]
MTLTAFPPAPQRPPEERERKRQWRAMRGIRSYLDLIDRGPEYECPVCRYVGRFAPVREQPGLSCPACDSRPRHRLMRLWMERELVLEPDMRVLHFAAEPALSALIRPRVVHYHTADVEPGADLQLDMTALDLPDASLDLIIANHVLEHLDDRAALAELHRVLAPDGLVVLTVPLVDGWEHTYEDPALTPEQRQLRYTDSLHLRLYGRDFPDRIAEAGFLVSDFTAVEPDVSRFGLKRGERVFIGQKPA